MEVLIQQTLSSRICLTLRVCFVTADEEIFVDNRVARWTSNGTELLSPMSICSQCSGLFVDSTDQLYCSQYMSHQVLRRSLQNLSSPTMIGEDFYAWQVVRDRRVQHPISSSGLERWISIGIEICSCWIQTIIEFKSTCWQRILAIVSARMKKIFFSSLTFVESTAMMLTEKETSTRTVQTTNRQWM